MFRFFKHAASSCFIFPLLLLTHFPVSFFKARYPTEITDNVTEWLIMWGGSGWPITHPEAHNGNGGDYPGSGRCHIMHRDLGKPGRGNTQGSGSWHELTYRWSHTPHTQAHCLCLTNPFKRKKKIRYWNIYVVYVYFMHYYVQIYLLHSSTLQYALPYNLI